MQTLTQRATKRVTPDGSDRLPYPKLVSGDGPLFWLSAYLRDAAELAALEGLGQEMCRRKRSEVVRMAIYGAINAKRDEIKTSLGYVVQEGRLLLAHPTTTALEVAA